MQKRTIVIKHTVNSCRHIFRIWRLAGRFREICPALTMCAGTSECTAYTILQRREMCQFSLIGTTLALAIHFQRRATDTDKWAFGGGEKAYLDIWVDFCRVDEIQKLVEYALGLSCIVGALSRGYESIGEPDIDNKRKEDVAQFVELRAWYAEETCTPEMLNSRRI